MLQKVSVRVRNAQVDRASNGIEWGPDQKKSERNFQGRKKRRMGCNWPNNAFLVIKRINSYLYEYSSLQMLVTHIIYSAKQTQMENRAMIMKPMSPKVMWVNQ